MKLAYRTSTGQVVPDFQTGATAAGLLANAVRAGIPANDVEVRDVDAATYAALEDATYGAARAATRAQLDSVKTLSTTVLADLGLTKQRLLALRYGLETAE